MYPAVLQGPCDMVKARMLEPQFPVVKLPALANMPTTRCRNMAVGNSLPEASIRQTMTNEVIQGSKRGTYIALERPPSSHHGIAYGTRVLWQRSHHSSQRMGKPSTRRRVTGFPDEREA